MQTISLQLRDLDGELEIHNEHEWTGGNGVSLWHAFNDAGVECEVGEFLYGFMRMIKPLRVLETGTHWGVSASYIGMALKDNNYGQLDTYEFLPEIHEKAEKRIIRLKLENYVNPYLCDVGKLKLELNYDFMFLDTEPQTRFTELIKFYPNLNEGGYVFIHDLHRHMHQIENADHGFAWPYGKIPGELEKLVNDGKLVPFHFSTPRGLTMFYKPKKEDYKWQ